MSRTQLITYVDQYLTEVKSLYDTGIAREHAYRPAQIALLNRFPDVIAVNDAAKSDAGFPDFTVLRGSKTDISRGHGEGKDVGLGLDKIESSPQFTRYMAEYGNLFLTNALEWRFYREGESVGNPIILGSINKKTRTLTLEQGNSGLLVDAIESFLEQPPEQLRSATRLATIMAGKSRLIRSETCFLLTGESDSRDRLSVERIFKLVKSTLSPEMTPEEFADMYAQTMVYGLFAARFHDASLGSFSRQEARDLLHGEGDFLRTFFDHIAGASFPERLRRPVNDLCEVFAVSDVYSIVTRQFKKRDDDTGRDPIIHFYEQFLREYDAGQRKDRGVYYTPTPVVRYIIRAVDNTLTNSFKIAGGIANADKKAVKVDVGRGAAYKTKAKRTFLQEKRLHRVQVLDPAVGTATFLNETIRYIHTKFEGQEGLWPAYVEEDLIPRLHGFELMMAPYAIAHLKIGMTLNDLGHSPREAARIFLTNTLDAPSALNPDLLAFAGLAGAFTREAQMASEVKVENPIMVVIGNPPYSGHSENRTEYANSLVKKYKKEPGGQVKLQEKNPKWLNDDYVKFIAFSEELIAKNPDGGILAMITNNGYLDNPTFRGMRWHLTKTFDEIRVIDLHGSTKKREGYSTRPDSNVFDIQQGVAIIIAVKRTRDANATKAPAKVLHAELYGTRAEKFAALEEDTLEFTEVDLDPKFFFFQPRSQEGRDEYESGLPLNKIFNHQVIGLFTGRDKLTVDMNLEALKLRVDDFRFGDPEDMRSKYSLGKDVRDWGVERAQADVNSDYSEKNYTPIAYRPFDERWTYYTGRNRGFYYYARNEVMSNLLGDHGNFALVAGRQGAAVGDGEWSLAYVAKHPVDLNIFYRGGGQVFPYKVRDKTGQWISNINPRAKKTIERAVAHPVEDLSIFDYVYGVLNSPSFRKHGKEFLKSDYPIITAPRSNEEFESLRTFGAKVRKLHLLENPDDLPRLTTFPIPGTNTVTGRRHVGTRLWINEMQYLEGVSPRAWAYTIGGYQVLDKWLKDRRNMKLSREEITHLQRTVAAISEVLRLTDGLI